MSAIPFLTFLTIKSKTNYTKKIITTSYLRLQNRPNLCTLTYPAFLSFSNAPMTRSSLRLSLWQGADLKLFLPSRHLLEIFQRKPKSLSLPRAFLHHRRYLKHANFVLPQRHFYINFQNKFFCLMSEI